MSGRALFPITLRLAAKVAGALPDPGMRISYCGGVSALNAADLIKAGLGPLTLATDILKPGGYLRLAQIAREASGALPLPLEAGATDAAALESLAAAALERPEYRKGWKSGTVSMAGKLPLHDCFAAPCVEACPVNQKVPAYVAAQGAGRSEEALAAILSDNPLPHITGLLCDHVCQEHCSRLDYEGPVRIRDMKLAAARAATMALEVASWMPPAKITYSVSRRCNRISVPSGMRASPGPGMPASYAERVREDAQGTAAAAGLARVRAWHTL